LKSNPEKIDDCINEVLRLECPVQYTGRLVRNDIAYRGISMKAGELVIVDIAAANRDPLVFDAPDEFNISRESIPHLAFGFGAHYCLGAILSLMECRTVLKALIEKDISQNASSVWSKNTLYRGLDVLPAMIAQK